MVIKDFGNIPFEMHLYIITCLYTTSTIELSHQVFVSHKSNPSPNLVDDMFDSSAVNCGNSEVINLFTY